MLVEILGGDICLAAFPLRVEAVELQGQALFAALAGVDSAADALGLGEDDGLGAAAGAHGCFPNLKNR
jgi:hypothetical protein